MSGQQSRVRTEGGAVHSHGSRPPDFDVPPTNPRRHYHMCRHVGEEVRTRAGQERSFGCTWVARGRTCVWLSSGRVVFDTGRHEKGLPGFPTSDEHMRANVVRGRGSAVLGISCLLSIEHDHTNL